MTPSTLSFRGLRFSRGPSTSTSPAFSLEVDTEFPAGELTVILGPSGCGKTTLLDLAAGFLQPESGQIMEGEQDVTGLPPERRRIGMVFQDHALFPHMSVEKNIMYGPLSRGTDREKSRQKARELIDLVHLAGYARRRPASLSGGERQRVALARALAIDPDVLLLDEPFSALDAALRREMRSELRRIQRLTGITAVLVTHDQEEAMAMADHLAIMDGGRIVEEGPPEQMWRRPATMFTATFLGRSSRLKVDSISRSAKGDIDVITAAGPVRMTENSFRRLAGRETRPDSTGYSLVFRAEELMIRPGGPLSGQVSSVEFTGGRWLVNIEVPGEGNYLVAEVSEGPVPQVNEQIELAFRESPNLRFLET